MSAVLAVVFIETYMEQGEAGEETEDGTDWTNRVAIGSSVFPSQDSKDDQGEDGDDEGGDAAHPDLYLGEVITVVSSIDGG